MTSGQLLAFPTPQVSLAPAARTDSAELHQLHAGVLADVDRLDTLANGLSVQTFDAIATELDQARRLARRLTEDLFHLEELGLDLLLEESFDRTREFLFVLFEMANLADDLLDICTLLIRRGDRLPDAELATVLCCVQKDVLALQRLGRRLGRTVPVAAS